VKARLRGRGSGLSALVLGVLFFLFAFSARAAGEDAAVHDAVLQILREDFPANLASGKKKLQEQLSTCLKRGCSGAVKAEVHVALGVFAAQQGQADEARQAFKSAVAADPNAKLPDKGVTPSVRAAWDDAKGAAAPPAAPPPEEQGIAATVPLIRDALKADQEGRLDECIEKDKAALKIDDSQRTRLHLASCEARAGKLVDALKNTERAGKMAYQKRDATVLRIAAQRTEELLARIPHVTFVPPTGVQNLQVTFDERPVPTESLTKKFSVDPGKHRVVATGLVNGFTAQFDEEYDIKEKDFLRVTITLKPPANDFITPGQIKCMLAAKSQEEVQKCLPQNQKSLVVRAAADLSGYSDTNSVAVYTPAANISLVSPTAGWNLGGNILVDAVSAASPDIVSSASPPFTEYRYAGGVTGGYKPGLFGAQASASASSSPDYASYTGGLRLTADLLEKRITPTAGYSYSYDRVGRGPNNYLNGFNPLKGYIHIHEVEVGVTIVLSPTALLVVGGTLAVERGDGSQPYRYIPMFDPEFIAPLVPRGARVDLVNRTRLPVKPLEQLPTERDRFALGFRFNKRLDKATIRIEQRFYNDTWGMKASSTDGRYMVDVNRSLRAWPHLRIHAQTDTNFYNLAYTAILPPPGAPGGGQVVVPLYRTGDRELSPLLTATAGGGARISLGEPEGEVKYGITFVGDIMYTRYLKALYVTSRTAIYGSIGFDVEF
jgi:tetratricopeptide (TPR) repeat protein